MTPNNFEDQAAAVANLYAAAEEVMLERVARRLKRGITEEGWAERKLAEVQQMRKDAEKIVAANKSKSKKERDKLMREANDYGVRSFDSEYTGDHIVGVDGIPQSRLNAMTSLITELDGSFDALDSRILRNVDDEYRNIIGNVVAMQSTGTISTKDALRSALDAFAAKGITGFVDRAGRKWNMDSYAEMAVRTGMMNAALQGYEDQALYYGEDLVIVTDHMDECPLCQPWERKVLSLTGLMRDDPECDDTLENAKKAGLFHPNCLHAYTVYVKGGTFKEGMKERIGYTPEQDAAGYEARQKQRYMERQIRQYKRRQAASITPEDERINKAYVERWQWRLREHLDRHPDLPRKYSREGGRVKLSEAAKKLPVKRLTTQGTGAIINLASGDEAIRAHIRSSVVTKKINVGNQNKHIRASKGYIEGRSFIFGDIDTAQLLVDTYHGTGEIKRKSRTGEWSNREVVTADHDIGVSIDPDTGEEQITNRFTIHYGKKGTHIVPTGGIYGEKGDNA